MNLYKFQTVNTNSLNALIESSLYFAQTKQLNDPTEGIFDLLGVYEEIYKKSDKFLPDFLDSEKVGVLSMAKGSPEEVEQSPFMWAHYGHQLKGFCLVFSFDDLAIDLEQHTYLKGEVEYCSGRSFPGITRETYGLEEVSGIDFKSKNKARVYKYCFFQKPKEFVGEQEFRFLSEKSGLKPYRKSSLEKVLIGEKMKPNERAVLLSNLESLGLLSKVRFVGSRSNSFKVHEQDFLKTLYKIDLVKRMASKSRFD